MQYGKADYIAYLLEHFIDECEALTVEEKEALQELNEQSAEEFPSVADWEVSL